MPARTIFIRYYVSDFAQAGLLCTLQRLNEAHLPALQVELETLAAERVISLILPCHAADLAGPALAHIVEQLGSAAFLSEVVVSMNGYSETAAGQASGIFAALPQNVRLLWTDGPALAPLLRRWSSATGKGLNVWAAIGLFATDKTPRLLVTQDADVASFRASSLARLCYACLHAETNYHFARMYYSRVTDRLYGRVSRLFLAPLLQAFIHVLGHHPLLDFLTSFRYPLAGETALISPLAAQLPLAAGWSLEIDMLCELFRRTDPRDICQVDGGTGYDHRHHPMHQGSALAGMAGEIAGALFDQLALEGLEPTELLRASVATAFRHQAALALRRSRSLAIMNGLPFDADAETEIVEAFIAQLSASTRVRTAVLPAWAEVLHQAPDWFEEYRERCCGNLS